MLDKSHIKSLTVKEITEVLREEGVSEPEVTGPEGLADLGLSSLVLARVLIGLEDVLGVDPFGGDLEDPDVRTVDDLADAYAHALERQETS